MNRYCNCMSLVEIEVLMLFLKSGQQYIFLMYPSTLEYFSADVLWVLIYLSSEGFFISPDTEFSLFCKPSVLYRKKIQDVDSLFLYNSTFKE